MLCSQLVAMSGAFNISNMFYRPVMCPRRPITASSIIPIQKAGPTKLWISNEHATLSYQYFRSRHAGLTWSLLSVSVLLTLLQRFWSWRHQELQETL